MYACMCPSKRPSPDYSTTNQHTIKTRVPRQKAKPTTTRIAEGKHYIRILQSNTANMTGLVDSPTAGSKTCLFVSSHPRTRQDHKDLVFFKVSLLGF